MLLFNFVKKKERSEVNGLSPTPAQSSQNLAEHTVTHCEYNSNEWDIGWYLNLDDFSKEHLLKSP